jgi:hypothetical protein
MIVSVGLLACWSIVTGASPDSPSVRMSVLSCASELG